MPVEVKRLGGVMNTDDNESDILAIQHTDAKNIRFTGGANGLTSMNIKGNFLINNSDLPTGANECCGCFYDSVKHRILWFNYNSNTNHGLYQLLVQTGQVSKIFLCGTDSATDILNLDLNNPVHSMAIVYRTEDDGDLLYWLQEDRRPKYLNLDTIQTLAPFTEDMINAAKNAPGTPPQEVEYQDDATATVNNLKKKLFRFIYRWGYANGEKSTWSPISKVPIPVAGADPDNDNDPTINSNIKVPVVGGGDDYTEIEIAAQQSLGATWSDFFSVVTLNADQYNIAPGATYNFLFYNDGVYTFIDPLSTDLYFSWLPDKANTLELLNGNVLIYAGITDGYDLLTREQVDVTITTGLSSGSGVSSISHTNSGAYKIIVNIGSVVTNGAIYNISFDYNNGSDPPFSISENVTASVPPDTQDSITDTFALNINGLALAGLTATNIGGGVLEIEAAIPGNVYNASVSVSTAGTENAAPSWKWACSQRLGLIYFDDRNKTNGVISFVSESSLDTTDFAVTTPEFSTISNVPQVPFLSGSINHTPPTWATKYQWVRADLTPEFLHWITNDYQTDTDFLYFGIQNLIYQKTKSTGFVPSYEFVAGDRIRVMAKYNSGTGFYTPYNIQLDMEILGTTTRTMTSPASTGIFIKVAKPATLPSLAYSTYMFVEIYTPKGRLSDETQLFYEWGEKFNIYESGGFRYHRGQLTDQTAVQPATFQWFDGDVYYKNRGLYIAVDATTLATAYMMDDNYNDYYGSAVNSSGRGWVIDSNAKEEYNQVLLRWGGKFQPGTNINELSIFRPNDFDEADRAKGDIRRLKARDRILRVFQDRGVGQFGVYARFIQNNSGVPELVTTNEIITVNNIQYYQGQYGLCGYPTNLCSSTIADYFVDVVTGREVRLSGDGITDLGLLYKGEFYLSGLVVPYNKELSRANGYSSKVMKYWDTFENQSHTVLQGGGIIPAPPFPGRLIFSFNESISSSEWGLAFFGAGAAGDKVTLTLNNGSVIEVYVYTCSQGDTVFTVRNALIALINVSANFSASTAIHGAWQGLDILTLEGTIDVVAVITYGMNEQVSAFNYSFNEKRNAFCSFYDFIPEWAISADNMVYTFKNGEIYKHDNQLYYCNFYSSQFGCHITTVFNQNLLEKKSWQSITEIASDKWSAPIIYTDSKSYIGQRQQTNLIAAEFVNQEDKFVSSIKRDQNSRGQKLNGQFMKGSYLAVKFQKENAVNLVTLSELIVKYSDSPLNIR